MGPLSKTATRANLIAGSALILCLWQGAAVAEPKTVSTYYPAFGHAVDAALANNGDVLVSLGGTAAAAGIQIYSPSAGFANPCGGGRYIDYAALGISTVEGIAVYPNGRRQDASKTQSIAAAVEQNGAEFLRADLRRCAVDGAVNVEQDPIQGNSPGSFAVAITPRGQPTYAFVANEYGIAATSRDSNMGEAGTVGIVRVRRADCGKFKKTTGVVPGIAYIYIPGANTVPGVTVSHDGKRLYVVNEGTAVGTYPPGHRYGGNLFRDPTGSGNPDLTTERCVNEYGKPTVGNTRNGVLTVIDIAKAVAGRGQHAIIQTIAAGCSPVRVVETRNGKFLFVASRGGNPGDVHSTIAPVPGSVGRVLVFDTGKLLSRDLDKVNRGALVNVMASGGTAPVGMALFRGDRRLAVANSNRFTQSGTGKTSVAILNVRCPTKTKGPEVVCESPQIGAFPRGLTADGSTLYVANFGSPSSNVPGSLQVIEYRAGKTSGCAVGPYPAP